MKDIIFSAVMILYLFILLSFPVHLLLFGANRIRARKDPAKKKYPWFLLIVHLFLFLLVVAAIIIPNLTRFAAPSKQSEFKTNLGAIYVAQLSYFSNTNTYASGPDAFKLLQWEPAGQNRYAYYCQGAMIPNKLPMNINYTPLPDGRWPVALKPASSKTGFTCMAVGNIDNDETLDVWSINDGKILRNDLNDI